MHRGFRDVFLQIRRPDAGQARRPVVCFQLALRDHRVSADTELVPMRGYGWGGREVKSWEERRIGTESGGGGIAGIEGEARNTAEGRRGRLRSREDERSVKRHR